LTFSTLSNQIDTANSNFDVKIPKTQHIEGRKEDLPLSNPALIIGMIAEF